MKKISLALLALILGFTSCKEKPKTEKIIAEKVEPEPVIIKEYGFVLNNYKVVHDTIQSGDTFGKIMDQYGIGPGEVYEITHVIEDTFDPRLMVLGTPYTMLLSKDTTNTVEAFIYQHDKINYTVVSLADSISAERHQKPVSIKRRTASSIISSSLSSAMAKEGLGIELSHALANIYRWKIDFFRLQKGDKFKLIYNEKYIDDTVYAGIENIEAAVFIHRDETFYAFRYGNDSITKLPQYYDENADALQSFFLKAPVDFTRISSRYQKRRFHPVLHSWRSHLGTDYAAPYGTPIWTTADGVVIAASYTSGNGNYVKVRHNDKYTTQYLHMSKRNVHVGDYVKQGDIIGYVGATGLATGPHVCYRFWVWGKQVDPYKQDLPSSEPLPEKYVPDFKKQIAPRKKELDSIAFKTLPTI